MRSESVLVNPAEGLEPTVLLDIFNLSRARVGCYPKSALDVEGFSALIEGEGVHVAVSGGTPVGFVSVWPADRFIHHLYVLPRYQGNGVGSALLRTCETTYGLPLSLKCDTCNERAQRFYRNKGWVSVEKGVGPDGPWERFRLSRP